MALIQKSWLKSKTEIDPSIICEKYLDCYLSSIFYSYELNLPCNFMIPEPEFQRRDNELKQISNNGIQLLKAKDLLMNIMKNIH